MTPPPGGAQVANEFKEIGLLLDDDRLIPVLEEVAGPLVPAVEGAGVARQETPHGLGERAVPGADQRVGVIREERPGVDREAALRYEVGVVGVIPEDAVPLKASHPHVVQDPGGVEARLAKHNGRTVAPLAELGNVPYFVAILDFESSFACFACFAVELHHSG